MVVPPTTTTNRPEETSVLPSSQALTFKPRDDDTTTLKTHVTESTFLNEHWLLVIIIAFLGGIILLLIVGISIYCCFRCKKKRKRNNEKNVQNLIELDDINTNLRLGNQIQTQQFGTKRSDIKLEVTPLINVENFAVIDDREAVSSKSEANGTTGVKVSNTESSEFISDAQSPLQTPEQSIMQYEEAKQLTAEKLSAENIDGYSIQQIEIDHIKFTSPMNSKGINLSKLADPKSFTDAGYESIKLGSAASDSKVIDVSQTDINSQNKIMRTTSVSNKTNTNELSTYNRIAPLPGVQTTTRHKVQYPCPPQSSTTQASCQPPLFHTNNSEDTDLPKLSTYMPPFLNQIPSKGVPNNVENKSIDSLAAKSPAPIEHHSYYYPQVHPYFRGELENEDHSYYYPNLREVTHGLTSNAEP